MENAIGNSQSFIILVAIMVAALLLGWVYFFSVVKKNSSSVRDVLEGTSFLQNLTVIVVVATAGCLAVVGILKGELVATLLSGIVGYVLGSIKGRSTVKGTKGRSAADDSAEE